MPELPDSQRCLHTTRDGKRCHAARFGEQMLCKFHHDRAEKKAAKDRQNQQSMIQKYFQPTTALQLFPADQPDMLDTALGVNRYVAGVARLVAAGQLDPRVGSSLGYLGQIMLTTIPLVEAQRQAPPRVHHPMFPSGDVSPLNQIITTIDTVLPIQPAPSAHAPDEDSDETESDDSDGSAA